LFRNSLIEKIKTDYDGGVRHYLFYAPPATGKTALAQLLMNSLPDVHKIFIPCADFENIDPFQVLAEQGIDLQKHTTKFRSPTLIVLDDCHTWFGNDSFWSSIVRSTSLWCPPHIRFLFIATTMLDKPKASPLSFQRRRTL
jgi:predicted AAA+ superfamily ATPase